MTRPDVYEHVRPRPDVEAPDPGARGREVWQDDSAGTLALPADWHSFTGPQGGLLAAAALAAVPLAPDDMLRSVTTRFLTSHRLPAAEIRVDAVRAGRSSSLHEVHLRDAGSDRPATTALVTCGRRDRPGPQHLDRAAPAAGRPADHPLLEPPVEVVPFFQHLELRLVSGTPFAAGADAELLAWVRFRSPLALDAAALAVLADCSPPSLYCTLTAMVPIPSVELSVVLTGALPPGQWVLMRTATRWAGGGWCVDDTELWDSGGALLALGRQTRLVLT